MFSLVRVDDRVIHGQVVTSWMRQYACEALIVVDDEIGNSDILKTIFKNAAIGKNVYIFTVEQAITKVKEAANSDKPYFLIAKSPIVYQQLHQAGINIGPKVFLGNVSGAEGKTLIALSVCLSDEENKSCEYLVNNGVEVIIQSIPNGPAFIWKDTYKGVIAK